MHCMEEQQSTATEDEGLPALNIEAGRGQEDAAGEEGMDID